MIRPLLLLLCLWLAACRPEDRASPVPVSQRVAWSGRFATDAKDSVLSDTVSAGACLRTHRLEFAGTDPLILNLREYRTAYWAFAAFRRLERGEPPREGWLATGDRVYVVHGAYLGELDSAAGSNSVGTLRDRLKFVGSAATSLPPEFESFPLLGRIPNSERVGTEDFLGHAWEGPIFSVAYHCHGDTALAFRGFPQSAKRVAEWMFGWKGEVDSTHSGREWRFKGVDEFRRPMIFGFFSEGVAGFSGCFDPLLAQEYIEKMKKTQVFWHKP